MVCLYRKPKSLNPKNFENKFRFTQLQFAKINLKYNYLLLVINM